MKIILFSPVCQDHETLELVLKSHANLEGITDRWYYDDNTDPESSALLRGQHLLPSLPIMKPVYSVDETTHHWNGPLISRIAKIRNAAIKQFLHWRADALFIVDADLILNPKTVLATEAESLPIVSQVFWSKWDPKQPWMPNVWDEHPYQFFENENVTRLREPGCYRVGGLGACTLITRAVLEQGVNYSPVKGLYTMFGEDRWFCVRASSSEFSLHASTTSTPFHVYRKSMLPEAKTWYAAGADPRYFREKWLTDEWKAFLERKAA